MATSQPSTVVLQVDDLPEEALLLRLAFAQAGIADRLRVVHTGQLALNYLAGIGQFADRSRFPFPCLVLLDIDMPGMSGFDVLAKIRADPQFQHLPVCMYSSSSEDADIDRALALGADSHIEKPLGFTDQVELARNIARAWFGHDTAQHAHPRILLRKRRQPSNASAAGCFLQPDGHWSENRQTARQFAHTVDAHWWAKEQDYLGAEVVLVYPDPSRDYPCIST